VEDADGLGNICSPSAEQMCMVRLEGIEKNNFSAREKQNSDSRAKEVIMLKELSFNEIEEVSGGQTIAQHIVAGFIGWVVSKVADAAVSLVTGPTNVCTAGGATKGGPICPVKR
jgi:hypothetical protein